MSKYLDIQKPRLEDTHYASGSMVLTVLNRCVLAANFNLDLPAALPPPRNGRAVETRLQSPDDDPALEASH